MTVSRKYIAYLATLSIIEIIIIFSQEKKIVSASVTWFAVLAFGVFLFRFILCWNLIFKYLKTNHYSLYEKQTYKIFFYRAPNRYALKDEEVIDALDEKTFNYVKEIRFLQIYFVISFILFVIFAIGTVISNMK